MQAFDAEDTVRAPQSGPDTELPAASGNWMLHLMNARLDSARERSKNDVHQLQAELLRTIGHLPTKSFLVTTILGALALVLAVLSFGGDRWDGGYQASSQYAFQIEQLRASTTEQFKAVNRNMNARMSALESKLNEVVAMMASKPNPSDQDQDQDQGQDQDQDRDQDPLPAVEPLR